MSPVDRVPVLRGRGEEERALRRLLDGASAGSGGALVLAGPPGMGKTALLDLAAASPGFRVLRVSGVEPESCLPYSGLHALLHPIAASVRLPDAQAGALAAALESGAATGGLALPAAVLGLLAAVAADRPVLACVDDADLLDPGSREVLSFAARRLSGKPVALVFAARSPGRDLAGLPVRVLEGLDAAAVRELAGDLAPGKVAEDLLAAVDQIARGNPLALAELIGALTPDQLAGLAAPPVAPPRDGRLWRAHADRLAALPARTRRLLLLVAADPGVEAEALIRAAHPACALTALEPAEHAGLLRCAGDRYDFPDPAVRAVAYHGASLL
ncbi:AAA family ATPase, partial [Nonomuraea aridisoli]